MKKRYEELCKILRKDSRFIDNKGNLLKNKIQEGALKLDENLLKILLESENTKNQFFKKINGIMVFDKIKFSQIVNSNEFLPDSYTQFIQDIMLVDECGNSIANNTDVVLEFPHKDCILEFDSTKEKDERNEAFLNETLMNSEIDTLLAPKVFCNAILHEKGSKKETKEMTENDNLLIKGNNLIAMHSLVKRYAGQIKLMYWDILYNTNNDKVPYNDSFKHSSWLTMMKNRLNIAKELLKPDGIICIECDKNEDAYLKVLCDEIFDRDNFINSIAIESSTPSGQKTSHKDKTILKTKDTILIYKKGGNPKIEPQYTISNKITNYSYWFEGTKDNFKIYSLREKLIENGLIDKKMKNKEITILPDTPIERFLVENANKIFRRQPSMPNEIKQLSAKNKDKIITYKNDDGEEFMVLNKYRISFLANSVKDIEGKKRITKLLCDIWTDISFHGTQYEGNVNLPNGQKPERLVLRLIDMFTKEGDIVLDAYSGCATTGSVCLKTSRRFILIEQLDSHYEKSLKRLDYTISGSDNGPVSEILNWKGGGNFISMELACNSQKIIDKVLKAKNDKKLNEIYNELKESDFVIYRVDINKLEKRAKGFESLNIEEKKKVLINIIDKNTLYINYSDIDDNDYKISDQDKSFTNSFYKGGK